MIDNYRIVDGFSSVGSDGSFGIQIHLGGSMLDGVESEKVKDAIYRAMEKIKNEVMAAHVAADPKSLEQAKIARQEILAIFYSQDITPIFVEEIPNGYWGDTWHSRHLPWFNITTRVGHFVIGHRKRVISIDWKGTIGTKTAEELFPDEEVTKQGRSIHAWSFKDACRYVCHIIATARA